MDKLDIFNNGRNLISTLITMISPIKSLFFTTILQNILIVLPMSHPPVHNWTMSHPYSAMQHKLAITCLTFQRKCFTY